MADPAEVGKYGTIRLLKRREPSGVVAVYPVDDEAVSFGRDASCSVRLYYPEVSPMHCKIIFEERKAFLQVFGASGVIVDDCPVYPMKSAIIGEPSATVTIPLPNGSIFEIQKKRFMFNYPPKALRPQLFTPATVRRKNIRMSMVQSAQVFSPAPSQHPRENLRVLQSPLKLPSSDMPVKLVDGDHPRVYEEEQDLVILEDVEPQLNGHHPVPSSPVRLQTLPPLRQGPPQTPRRRPQPSLHRAVLIRSAQRTAYMRGAQEQQQRQQYNSGNQFEEIDLRDDDAEGEDEDSDDEKEEEDEVVNSILNVSTESEEDTAGEEKVEETNLDDVIKVEEVENNEQDITEAQEEDEGEGEQPRYATPLLAGRTLHLGAFKTPQPGLFARKSNDGRNERRKTGPQRPPPGFQFALVSKFNSKPMVIKEEEMDQDRPESKDPPTSPSKRRGISEEERKAILERRRSALKIPDPDIGESVLKFGQGGASSLPSPLPPPTSPFKTLSTHIDEGEDTQVVLRRMQAQVAERRASLSPTRPRIARDTERGVFPPSPTKTFSLLAQVARLNSPSRELPDFDAEMAKESHPQRTDAMELDDASSIKSHAEANVETAERDTQPQTPRLDGVREMFREPRFLQTPRMDGIRQLFVEQRSQETPDFDGIGDMMHVDEPAHEEAYNESDGSGKQERPVNVPEDVAASVDSADSQQPRITRKLLPPTRTLTRSKGARPALIRSHGTPTDASTMADDEASPDSGPVDSLQRLKPGEGVPEAAVVHRTGRGRRASGIHARMDTEQVKVPSTMDASNEPTTKSPPRRGRTAKTITGESDAEEDNNQQSAKPPSKSRGRRKMTPQAGVSDSEATGDGASRSTRRGKRAGSAQSEERTPAPTPARRRTTRARSRSTEPQSDDNAEINIKTGIQTTGTAVETIPEEEEPVSVHAQPPRQAGPAAPTRSRRTRMRTDSSAEDAPPKKRAGASKASVAESNAESTSHVEDKENTPETSPVSESGEDSSVKPAKPSSKGRTGAKVAAGSRSKAGLNRAKPASKTTKVKTEDEDTTSTPAPRATRSRARK